MINPDALEKKNVNQEEISRADSERILVDIVHKSIQESRTKKWMWFIVSIFFISYLIVNMMNANKNSVKDFGPHLSLVTLEGPIGPGTNVDAHKKIGILEESFEDSNSRAIVIKANSPGGSPAHAKILYDRIISLKKETGKKVYFSIEDTCASACYYIAAAADEIYVTPLSIVGSIGVKMDSWDFTGIMNKLGIKNDTIHSGKNKLLMNPYGEKDPEVTKYLEETVLSGLHDEFIKDVKKTRLKLTVLDNSHPIFSGLVFTGRDSVKNGLADEIGDIYDILERENRPNEDLKYKDMSPRHHLLQKLFGNISSYFLGSLF